MVEVSYQMTKIDLAQRCQRNIAQSSLNYHKNNSLQKDNDAMFDMRTQCVKDQQHAKNLRRNNYVNVAEVMCKLVNQQSTPEVDIDVFRGNPLDFFMAVFDEAVEKKIENPHGKLTPLIKYITGEVKKMVKNCM